MSIQKKSISKYKKKEYLKLSTNFGFTKNSSGATWNFRNFTTNYFNYYSGCSETDFCYRFGCPC